MKQHRQPVLMASLSDISVLSWPFASSPDKQGTLWCQATTHKGLMSQQCTAFTLVLKAPTDDVGSNTKKVGDRVVVEGHEHSFLRVNIVFVTRYSPKTNHIT